MTIELSAAQRRAVDAVLAPDCGGINHMHCWPDTIADRTILSLRRRGILETGLCGIRMAQAVYPSSKCDRLTAKGKALLQ